VTADEDDMAFFMEPEVALARVAEDPAAPIKARVKAIEMIEHPNLCLLRRLLAIPTPRKFKKPRDKPLPKPVPSRVRAAAAIKYAQEMRYRRMQKAEQTGETDGNALGI
jgi:hypothetical protein